MRALQMLHYNIIIVVIVIVVGVVVEYRTGETYQPHHLILTKHTQREKL